MTARSFDLGFGNDPEVTPFERTLLSAIRFKSGADIGEIEFTGSGWDLSLNGSPMGSLGHHYVYLTGDITLDRHRMQVVVSDDVALHTVTMPTSPADGDLVYVRPRSGANVDLDGNGMTVAGFATFSCSAGRSLSFVFVGSESDWVKLYEVGV